MKCSILKLSHLLGKKWSIPLIEEIALDKFSGFNNFCKRAKKITPRVLSARLKELEKYGLIERNTTKDATMYKLTAHGLQVHDVILNLKTLGIKWNAVPKKCPRTSCTECKFC